MKLDEFVKDLLMNIRKIKDDDFYSRIFSAPCQIDVLYSENDCLMTLVVKHDAKRNDEVHPHAVEERENLRDIVDKEILSDPYWSELDATVEIAGLLSRYLQTEVLKKMESPSLVQSTRVCGKGTLGEARDGIVQCLVDVKTDKSEDIVSSVASMDEVKQATEASVESGRKHLLSALWYPPFVFEDEPVSLKSRFVFRTAYKDYEVLLDNHSHIYIVAPIEPPLAPFMNAAVDCFNEIIGVAQFFGIEGCTVTRDDIVYFEFTKEFEQTPGYALFKRPNFRSLVSESFAADQANVYQFEKYCRFGHYRKAAVQEAVKKAEIVAQNVEVKSYVLSYLDAKTHFSIEQYKTSFLLAWIVLEKYIDSLWSSTLVSRNVSGKRLGKLAKSMLWTIDDKLEVLNLLGGITNERYFELVRLKEIRNKIVHKERIVTSQETEECLRFALDILKDVVRSRCLVEV
jgi:hypothetical protein